MLAEKGTLPPFISKGPFPSPRKDQMNPLVDLPMPVKILSTVLMLLL